jgi:ribonuclease P protein component
MPYINCKRPNWKLPIIVKTLERLSKGAQFERVRREGRTWGSGLMVLNAARNSESKIRCGFITSKKVGNAVHRNRARRLLREAVRLRLPHIAPGWDLVWIARAPISQATFWAVAGEIDSLLKRSRVLLSPNLSPLAPTPTATPTQTSTPTGGDVLPVQQSHS